MGWLSYFIMVPMVYAAVAVCVVGCAAKLIALAAAPRHPHTLRVFPVRRPAALYALADAFGMGPVRRQQPVLWVFLMLYHAAFALLILAHVDLIPGLRIMPAGSRHMLGSGAVGVALTLSVLYFLIRRFRSPVREISVPADYLLLLLLLFLFLTGNTISWANSWNPDGFVMGKEDFRAYLGGLASFSFGDPRDVLTGSHYIVVVLHVLLANLFLMLVPFSKVMHTFLSYPLNRLRRG